MAAGSCPPTLDSLPFDVFYQIATLLDERDSVHLSRTNRAIHELMKSDLIARKTVENVLAYSKEGRMALAAQCGYRKAVGHRFDIHEAIATASPYAVAMLAYAVDFVYHQGILCYHVGHEIRLLNVHRGARQEQVLNLHEVIPRLESGSPQMLDPVTRVRLLHYSNGIVAFRLEGLDGQPDTLVAIDMACRQTRRRRLLLQKPIPSEGPVIVRHSRSYLWYSVFFEAPGSQGVWLCCGVDLATDESIQFQLDHAVGGEVGQTIWFETYQDHLYVVSTQVTSEDDERFSSFYHWYCYAPRQRRRNWSGRLWRREHREGPINEMWTDLSIRVDESTNRPMILECRREWPDGGSANHRTTYIEPLFTPTELQAANPGGNGDSSKTHLDRHDNSSSVSTKDLVIEHANDHRPEKRLRRNYHPEHELGDDPNQRQEFIYAYTKHHSYDLPSSTFIDLVNHPTTHADGHRARDRLRLRTVSRKRKSPIDEEGVAGEPGFLFPPSQINAHGHAVEGSEERFVSRGVHLWPAEDAPADLHRLLCPDSRAGVANAVADERSLIYSVSCPGLPARHRAIILISFDPALHIPSMRPIRSLKNGDATNHAVPIELPKFKTSSGGLIKESDPLYQVINRGYWLR